jgi:hypothetical protein
MLLGLSGQIESSDKQTTPEFKTEVEYSADPALRA